MTNHRTTANDVLNEYFQHSRGTATQWSYTDDCQSTETISDAFRELAYRWKIFNKDNYWIVSDDTNNPVKPIGIEEII